jgi:hypothetical protein
MALASRGFIREHISLLIGGNMDAQGTKNSKPLDQLQAVSYSSRQMALDALKALILGESNTRIWTEKDENLANVFIDKMVYLAKKEVNG